MGYLEDALGFDLNNKFLKKSTRGGYENLYDIIAGQGRTDPRQMNLDLADISRTTQTQQQDLQGMLAGQGFQRSGLGAALSAAIGQSGAERRSRRISEETQLAEARKRQDLQLLLDLIINPTNQAYATRSGISMGQQQASSQKQGSALGAIGTAAGIAAMMMCWVARRVYGASDPKWLLVRQYMLTRASDELRNFYIARGEGIASVMTDADAALFRPHFDRMAAGV